MPQLEIRSPKRRAILYVAVSFAGVCALLVSWFAIWRTSLIFKNAGRLKSITTAGYPASARELDSWYPTVPSESNAAMLWLKGISKLNPKYEQPRGPFEKAQKQPWTDFRLPSRGMMPDDDLAHNYTLWVKNNEDSLALFHRAGKLSASRYPIDFTQGIFAEFPHLSPLLSSCQLLQVEAVLHASHTRSHEAAQSVLAILGAARSLQNEPVTISQLLRTRFNSYAFSTMEYVLGRSKLAETDLASLQRAFAEAESVASFSRALIGERASAITLMNSPKELRVPERSAELADAPQQMELGFNNPLMRTLGIFQRDMAFYLDFTATNINLLMLSDPQRFRQRKNADPGLSRLDRFHVLSALLLSASSKLIVKDVQDRARMRVAQMALAIERFKLDRNGNLPDSLSALAPAYLEKPMVDPFDGQLLRFRQRGSGYVIYSIGSDGKDSDGLEVAQTKQNENTPHDITFTVEH